VEIGQRRLDVIQLRTICRVLGTTLPDFVTRLEERLAQQGGQSAQANRVDEHPGSDTA
jgi:hypothetical protein